MAGLLNPQRSGLLGGSPTMIRQIMTPGTPGTGSPFMGGGMMGAGGAPAYGSDEWALQGGGPGALFWRQLAQAGVWNAMDPTKAGEVYSPETIGLLRPEFQQAYKKAKK